MSGSNYERKLAKHLDTQGYHVVRAPSSGGGTKRSLPDVFWAKPNENAIAAELKTISNAPAYVSKDEVTSLVEFAVAFNAKPRLILREKGDTAYYVIKPADCSLTEKSYRLDKDAATFTIQP